jgi:hypothetical protein
MKGVWTWLGAWLVVAVLHGMNHDLGGVAAVLLLSWTVLWVMAGAK